MTVAQREQDIILAEGQIGSAEDQLKRLLNVRSLPDWQRPIVTTDLPTMEPITVGVEDGMRQALQTRPEVRQALIDIESKKLTLVYNKSQLKPRLDLAGSYGYAGLGANAANQDLSYGDALSNIFDRNYPTWTVRRRLLRPDLQPDGARTTPPSPRPTSSSRGRTSPS